MTVGEHTGTLFYRKALGCLYGGLIGDAFGTPTEGMAYRDIERQFGCVDDFEGDGTDDTVMRNLLIEALVRTDGCATMDNWAQVWLQEWDGIFGHKVTKFFVSVLHTAHKLRQHAVPRMAALGNMPSSSSAMCIAPVGIVNACNPRQAAGQAYDLGGLIHTHDVGFCQDGAAAIAAGVAAAFEADADTETVVRAAREAMLPLSGREVLARIGAALELAAQAGDYAAFREGVYARSDRLFCRLACDSRETVPLTLALFWLAQGHLQPAVSYAANFGRDADTIGAMVGALSGALGGIESVPHEWVEKARGLAAVSQEGLAAKLVQAGLRKLASERRRQAALDALLLR